MGREVSVDHEPERDADATGEPCTDEERPFQDRVVVDGGAVERRRGGAGARLHPEEVDAGPHSGREANRADVRELDVRHDAKRVERSVERDVRRGGSYGRVEEACEPHVGSRRGPSG